MRVILFLDMSVYSWDFLYCYVFAYPLFFSLKQGGIKYHHLIFTGLTTKNNSQAHLWLLSGTKFCAYSYSEHK